MVELSITAILVIGTIGGVFGLSIIGFIAWWLLTTCGRWPTSAKRKSAARSAPSSKNHADSQRLSHLSSGSASGSGPALPADAPPTSPPKSHRRARSSDALATGGAEVAGAVGDIEMGGRRPRTHQSNNGTGAFESQESNGSSNVAVANEGAGKLSSKERRAMTKKQFYRPVGPAAAGAGGVTAGGSGSTDSVGDSRGRSSNERSRSTAERRKTKHTPPMQVPLPYAALSAPPRQIHIAQFPAGLVESPRIDSAPTTDNGGDLGSLSRRQLLRMDSEQPSTAESSPRSPPPRIDSLDRVHSTHYLPSRAAGAPDVIPTADPIATPLTAPPAPAPAFLSAPIPPPRTATRAPILSSSYSSSSSSAYTYSSISSPLSSVLASPTSSSANWSFVPSEVVLVGPDGVPIERRPVVRGTKEKGRPPPRRAVPPGGTGGEGKEGGFGEEEVVGEQGESSDARAAGDDAGIVRGLFGKVIRPYVARDSVVAGCMDLTVEDGIVALEAYADGFGFGVNLVSKTSGLFPLTHAHFPMTPDYPQGITVELELKHVPGWIRE
ncbi:hypothetical protein DFJ73DRAFT_934518 [Zopfochytrium polystomum]|nr:hypothetical protein DFJ73DRAFT_934518 [Zopfochytrium polystomum]